MNIYIKNLLKHLDLLWSLKNNFYKDLLKERYLLKKVYITLNNQIIISILANIIHSCIITYLTILCTIFYTIFRIINTYDIIKNLILKLKNLYID